MTAWKGLEVLQMVATNWTLIGVWSTAAGALVGAVTLLVQGRTWSNQSALNSQELWKRQRRELPTSSFSHTAISFYLRGHAPSDSLVHDSAELEPFEVSRKFPGTRVLESFLEPHEAGQNLSLLTREAWWLDHPILLEPDESTGTMDVELLFSRGDAGNRMSWQPKEVSKSDRRVLPFVMAK